LLTNGSRLWKASQVFGARAVSNLASNPNGPAVIFKLVIALPLLFRQPPTAKSSAAPFI